MQTYTIQYSPLFEYTDSSFFLLRYFKCMLAIEWVNRLQVIIMVINYRSLPTHHVATEWASNLQFYFVMIRLQEFTRSLCTYSISE